MNRCRPPKALSESREIKIRSWPRFIFCRICAHTHAFRHTDTQPDCTSWGFAAIRENGFFSFFLWIHLLNWNRQHKCVFVCVWLLSIDEGSIVLILYFFFSISETSQNRLISLWPILMAFYITFPILTVIRLKCGYVVGFSLQFLEINQSFLLLDKHLSKVLQAAAGTRSWWTTKAGIWRPPYKSWRRQVTLVRLEFKLKSARKMQKLNPSLIPFFLCRLQCLRFSGFRKNSRQLGRSRQENWSTQAKLFRVCIWKVFWLSRARIGGSKTSCNQLSQWWNFVSV